MYHAMEGNFGLLDGNGIIWKNGTSGIIRELRAIYAGNVIRAQMNKGYYRTTGGSSVNSNGPLIAPPIPSGFQSIGYEIGLSVI